MDTNSVELLIRLLAELAPTILALAALIEKLDDLDSQIRINREERRIDSDLLERLVRDLKGFVCESHEAEVDDRDSLP